jgi:hypothetical protein
MDKKQLCEVIAKAINFADNEDRKDQDQKFRLLGRARQHDRLSAFLSSLSGRLEQECPDAADLIASFQRRVTDEENPLINAAANGRRAE